MLRRPPKKKSRRPLDVFVAKRPPKKKQSRSLEVSVLKQPSRKKQRVLDSDHTKKLNENWEKKFQFLVKYKKLNDGSTLVPYKYDANPELGNWIHYQRQLYIAEELSTGRIDRLESIGFVWKVRIAVPWIDMYKRLVAYKEQYGTTLVPKRYKTDPAFGKWVGSQRHTCKNKDRIQLLNDIHFVWKVNRSSTTTKAEAGLRITYSTYK